MEQGKEAAPRRNMNKRDVVYRLMCLAERRDLPLTEEDVTALQQAARYSLNKVFQQDRATARKREFAEPTPTELAAAIGVQTFSVEVEK